MNPILFHELLKQHSMPPYQWNQYQFLRKCSQRLYYYYVLVLWATGGQANISTAYCHGFSSIYAAGKKGIYKIRPRSKERKRVQGGGESSSSIGKGEANANFISSLIHLEYIHCQDLETPRTDAIIINIEYRIIIGLEVRYSWRSLVFKTFSVLSSCCCNSRSEQKISEYEFALL